MGLQNTESRAAFISIANGKMCQQVQEPTATSISRVNMNGKTVHEEFYVSLVGRIVSIDVVDAGEYGKKWEVMLQDSDGENFKLRMSYSSGYSGAFLKTLPNVDLSKEVKLTPNLKEEDGKKRTTMFVSQGGNALKHFYNKADPKGLPQMVQIKVKNKLQWDDSEQMEFLENMVATTIVPKLLPAKAPAAVAPAGDFDDDQLDEPNGVEAPAGTATAEESDDDLPF